MIIIFVNFLLKNMINQVFNVIKMQHFKFKVYIMKEISRPFDVHKWSDHHEVNNFVNSIYDNHFKLHKSEILKKHLKVVLLDLYIAWQQHPNMKIGVHMYGNTYEIN